jgi:arabinofuranosyltransferase
MSFTRRQAYILSILLCLLLYAVFLLRTAWVCDDAYITLRTVDNFIHGYGLTWNVGERVQAYTHPLWMFLLSLIYFFTHEAFITTIVVSITVSLGAVSLYAFKIAHSTKTALLGMLIFILSKFFIDYSTSGLENPLTHLLLALFFITYFSERSSQRRVGILALTASLLMLTRLDLILIVAPALWFEILRQPLRRSLKQIIIGFLPLIVWELFSFWYYGSLIPNTGYAKLNTGIDSMALIVQGTHYLEGALRGDRLLILTIVVAVGLTIWRRGRAGWPVASGILLYIAYVIYSGGGFMGGRFLTAPLFTSVILLSRYDRLIASRLRTVIALVVILAVGLISSRSPVYSGSGFGLHDNRGLGYGIDDNRLVCFQSMGLWTADGWHSQPVHPWVEKGKQYRRDKAGPVVEGGIGLVGYYSGPKVHIIDIHALSDAFLARLPAVFKTGWRIGHFKRAIPEGYLATVASGQNRIVDPDLAKFYYTLNYVISGPLWDRRRITNDLELNLGMYDYWLINAGELLYSLDYKDLTSPVSNGTAWTSGAMHVFPAKGVRIDLDSVWHADTIAISLDGNDAYDILFERNHRKFGTSKVTTTSPSITGSVIYKVAVPDNAFDAGYDRVIITPLSGDGHYAVGYIAPLSVNRTNETGSKQ